VETVIFVNIRLVRFGSFCCVFDTKMEYMYFCGGIIWLITEALGNRRNTSLTLVEPVITGVINVNILDRPTIRTML